jgi:hypothetical protein
MTLPANQPTRKQRFNAALDLAGITNEAWRRDHHQVSAQHLNEVLNGPREGSAELNAAIDDLIDRYLVPLERVSVGTQADTSAR